MTETNSLGRMYAAWISTLSEMLTRRRAMARQWRTLLHHTPDGLEIHVREGAREQADGHVDA